MVPFDRSGKFDNTELNVKQRPLNLKYGKTEKFYFGVE